MLHLTRPEIPAPPLHYLDSADQLAGLCAQGLSRSEMARIAGLSIPQVTERLHLAEMDPGLQLLLRREGVPERIAATLLMLPDPLSRRRLAMRIVRERLCVRDAALLVRSARRRLPQAEPRQKVVTLIRDVRPYRNAVRDIAEQMKKAGVRASFTERKRGRMQELTIAYSARRRRTERFRSLYPESGEQCAAPFPDGSGGIRSFPRDML